MTTLEVIPIGENVELFEKVAAVVVAICIRENSHITYQCVWWDGNNRKCEWLENFEVTPSNPKSQMSIGYKRT